MHISEKQIDAVIDQMDQNENSSSEFIEKFASEQAEIWSYLLSECLPILKEKEADLLIYILAVLYYSIENSLGQVNTVDGDKFREFEEANWSALEQQKTKDFQKQLDPFFEKFPEEDLLAFVEDILNVESEEEISIIGREPMFIYSKSFLDAVFA